MANKYTLMSSDDGDLSPAERIWERALTSFLAGGRDMAVQSVELPLRAFKSTEDINEPD